MKRPLWTAGITCLVSGLAAFLLPIPALPVCGLLLLAAAGVLFVLRKKLPAAGALLITVFTAAAVTLCACCCFWQFRYAPAAAGAGSRQTIAGRVVSAVEQGDGTAHFTLEVQEAETLGPGTLNPAVRPGGGSVCRRLPACHRYPAPVPRRPVSLQPLYGLLRRVPVWFRLAAAGHGRGKAAAGLPVRFSDGIPRTVCPSSPWGTGQPCHGNAVFRQIGIKRGNGGRFYHRGCGTHVFCIRPSHDAAVLPGAGRFVPCCRQASCGCRRPACHRPVLCMVGFLLSAVRAFVMLCVLTGADMVGRHNDSLNSLGLAVLLWFCGTRPPHWMRAFCTPCLPVRALWAWAHRSAGHFWPGPTRKAGFCPGSCPQFQSAWALSLTMLPVSAMFGGTISPYTLLANLLIVPLSSVYVGCTLLAGLVGMLPLPFCFSLGKVLAVPVGLLGSAFTAVAKWLSALPFASFSLDYPVVRVLALGACGILCLFFLFRERNRKQMRRAVAAALAAILFCFRCAEAGYQRKMCCLSASESAAPAGHAVGGGVGGCGKYAFRVSGTYTD